MVKRRPAAGRRRLNVVGARQDEVRFATRYSFRRGVGGSHGGSSAAVGESNLHALASRSAAVAPMRLICKWCDQAVRINWRHDSRPIGDGPRRHDTLKVRGQKAKKTDVSASNYASVLRAIPRRILKPLAALQRKCPAPQSKAALIPRISTTTAANAMQVVRT